jgi:predicted membrane chloride channel (bestrophin family)
MALSDVFNTGKDVVSKLVVNPAAHILIGGPLIAGVTLAVARKHLTREKPADLRSVQNNLMKAEYTKVLSELNRAKELDIYKGDRENEKRRNNATRGLRI